MTERECGWTEWLSPGQPAGTPGVCAACGLERGYGDVKRCMRGELGKQTETVAPVAIHSGIGDRLEAAFGKWLVTASDGCSCTNLRDRLNSMTAKQVERWKRLPDLILSNVPHLSGPVGMVVKAMVTLAPGFARKRVQAAISRACQASQFESPQSSFGNRQSPISE